MADESSESEAFEDIEDAFEEMEETDTEMVDEADDAEAASRVDDAVEATVSDSANVIEVDADDVETEDKHVITGGEFEAELALDRETTADFLRDMAHQIESGTSLTVGGDGWEIPFEYAEPIEVEVEHEGAEDDRELEIEIEFDWGGASDHLEVR